MPLDDRLRAVRHVALDLDGTVYRGGTLFPFSKPFLAELRDRGIGYTFVTNNSSKNIEEYRKHLASFGLEVAGDSIATSTHAAILHLRTALPEVRRLYVLGTDSLKGELKDAGFRIDDEAPDAVLVGYDTTLTHAALCRAAWWLTRGLPFLATHPDPTCPTDKPTVLVDCGSLCACLTHATGRTPVVAGKPEPALLRAVGERHGLEPHELAMVGDRLSTDVAMARNAGATGVLVLSGATTRAQAERADPPPDLVVEDLADFGRRLLAARDAATPSRSVP